MANPVVVGIGAVVGAVQFAQIIDYLVGKEMWTREQVKYLFSGDWDKAIASFNSTESEYEYDQFSLSPEEKEAVKRAASAVLSASAPLPFVLNVLKSLFGSAKQASSPLILDLDGDGVETLGQDAGVFFDHDGNGFAQLSGWVAPDDGLLVWDRNGNGQIDDGSELFGNNSLLENGQKAANGFAALAELDKNGDGVLDASDAAFAALRVWRDKNSDGKVGEGELLTLDELGIQSLCTSYTVQQVVDANGNALRQQGSFTYVNGSTGQMGDVWFTEDTARSLPTERVEVPEEIAALPDVMAFGNVYSLHQAMARDESGALRTLVEEFAWADGYLTVGLPAAA